MGRARRRRSGREGEGDRCRCRCCCCCTVRLPGGPRAVCWIECAVGRAGENFIIGTRQRPAPWLSLPCPVLPYPKPAPASFRHPACHPACPPAPLLPSVPPPSPPPCFHASSQIMVGIADEAGVVVPHEVSIPPGHTPQEAAALFGKRFLLPLDAIESIGAALAQAAARGASGGASGAVHGFDGDFDGGDFGGESNGVHGIIFTGVNSATVWVDCGTDRATDTATDASLTYCSADEASCVARVAGLCDHHSGGGGGGGGVHRVSIMTNETASIVVPDVINVVPHSAQRADGAVEYEAWEAALMAAPHEAVIRQVTLPLLKLNF